MGGAKKKPIEIVKELLEAKGFDVEIWESPIDKIMKLPKEEILYIGDSKTDMQTGQNAGMDTIGVSWGFRGRKELEENHASYVVDHPEDILKFI